MTVPTAWPRVDRPLALAWAAMFKDAATRRTYGERGRDGVVVITTKAAARKP